jgi:predicted O-linked N-acetylglucosamine transferase (SPINDLY family)
VVTLRGDRHAGRVGASLLGQIGLTDLIANSVEEYVEIALALAYNPGRLDELCRSLRSRMAASSLCDGRAFARRMEAAFRSMWQVWCEAQDNIIASGELAETRSAGAVARSRYTLWHGD